MTEISIEDFCIALYCAYTRFNAVAPDAAGNLTFTARTLDGDRDEFYRVEFTGVQDFSFRSEAPDPKWGPQDKLELSAVELEGAPGSWRVWFNRFYQHEIEFRCRQLRVNGAEVVGRGKHLQDELPARAANVPPYSPGAA
jgi:hypothetical protein